MSDDPAGSRRPVQSLLGLGFELVVPIVLFMFAGRWLDGRLGTKPWLLIAGALLGSVVGFWGFVRRALAAGGGEKR
jgi:F0F1-type ATP synthase assembly protein I